MWTMHSFRKTSLAGALVMAVTTAAPHAVGADKEMGGSWGPADTVTGKYVDGTLVDANGHPITFRAGAYTEVQATCNHDPHGVRTQGDDMLNDADFGKRPGESDADYRTRLSNLKRRLNGQTAAPGLPVVPITVAGMTGGHYITDKATDSMDAKNGNAIHAHADATASAQLGIWDKGIVPDPQGNRQFDLYFWVKANGTCSVAPKADAVVNPDVALSNYEARAAVIYKNRFIGAEKERARPLQKNHKLGNLPFTWNNRTSGRCIDPLLITLTDVTTGEESNELLSYVETTFQDGLIGTTVAPVDFLLDSAAGVRLTVPVAGGADVWMSGQTPSAWLDHPVGDFGAELTGGVFTATGAWAGLPWALTYAVPGDPASGVIEATLAASYLADDFSYTIPADLMHVGDTYDVEASFASQENLSAVGTDAFVPEPATLGLLGVGLLALLRRRG